MPLTPADQKRVSFPSPTQAERGEKSASGLAGELVAAGIETRLIKFGEDWVAQLQEDSMPTRQERAFS